MLVEFKIAETETFQKNLAKNKFKSLYKKIQSYVYPQLMHNPYFGPNIKKLKGNLDQYFRYRIGNYRLFYKIDKKKVIVFMMDITDRKDAY